MDFQTVDAIFVPLCVSLVYDIHAHADENIMEIIINDIYQKFIRYQKLSDIFLHIYFMYSHHV